MRRLEHVHIFYRDALNVIDNTDDSGTFFFLDPPYIDTSLGHYEGYSKEDYIALLERLKGVKGKFLLTSFPTDILSRYTRENGWKTINNVMHLSASVKEGKMKTEVFTMNFSSRQGRLF